ncbi:putative snoRNA binding protein [Talaromyces proteolyticus]|uniref:SnoRNA binding protein n=1 Tax=Talaromyces proteolyticus TaxID=1131652 RepID=A0AAD4KJ72_9EURO|nr:putative snoRNA binding protein [Talaromyces proteolyticus]KAH8689791.1 putative snoRNA binding protein [Talaromyces proteolyticus]
MAPVPAEDIDAPLAKRQKTLQPRAPAKQESGSRIFSHFRTIGLVSPTSVPFTSVRLGKSTYQITTSIGNVLHTYDLKKGLGLVFASQPRTPKPITATFAWKNVIFAAWGGQHAGEESGVWVFRRGRKIASLEGTPTFAGPITRLLVFGSWIVGCCERNIQIWNSTSYAYYTTLIPAASQNAPDLPIFTGHICIMPTYLNKIFVGRYNGTVEIWNVSSGKLLHSIYPPTEQDGAVTAIEPTPALSLVAIAYKAGTIVIRNVASGKVVLFLNSNLSDAPPVTSISFRTDGLGAGEDGRIPGVMATAAVHNSDITLWDLNNGGRRSGSLRNAHDLRQRISNGGVNKIEFLDGQPVLISSGRDNALRSWIFDESPFSPIPRPLHSRGGHSAAVSALSFLPASSDGSDATGKWLLSASKDRSLWGFSLRKDSQNAELSQGNIKSKSQKKGILRNETAYEDLKAPEITSIACSLTRDAGMGVSSQQVWTNSRDTKKLAQNANGWESVVTAHKGDKFARTWYWGKKKAGRWAFETSDGTEVKSVAVSACGTFAVVGSSGGSVDMFNLQSGVRRQQFPPPSNKKSRSANSVRVHETDNSGTKLNKHTKAVTGLSIDSLNRYLVSCGLDGKLKFWDFSTGLMLTELDWSPTAAITSLRSSDINELVALSCDDLSIRVVDLETKRVVRELWGCRGQINDFTFSNDGRWIIASSMDSAIRVWDLPTGHLIDIFQVPTTCTSLAFSGTGEFLATAHSDELGVHIWNNKALFSSVQPNHIDENEVELEVNSTAITETKSGMIDAAFATDVENKHHQPLISPAEQLSDDLMTLSIVPRATWQTLINLETIKERNKPKEPVKAPERAPFFLQSLGDTQKLDSDPGLTNGHRSTDLSQISNTQLQPSQMAHFSRLLQVGASRQNFACFIDYFKTLSPSKIDLEIRSLDSRFSRGRCELVDFVNALTERLRQKRDFELVNAWMAVFLKVHAELITNTQDGEVDTAYALQAALSAWKSEQQKESRRLSELMGYCRGIIGFLRSPR